LSLQVLPMYSHGSEKILEAFYRTKNAKIMDDSGPDKFYT